MRVAPNDSLASVPRPARALVVGASGGLGGALAARLAMAGLDVCATARNGGHDVTLDVTDEASIAAACAGLAANGTDRAPLRIVVVASGLLHDGALQPEKSLRALDAGALTRAFAVNAIGPALVAKHTLPLMPRAGRCVFAVLSARVGSIADNRLGGWYAYRASKAALNQILRTLAIEARRTHPDLVVAALHPGTVATQLSAPYRGERDTFSPDAAAENLLRVIDGLAPADSGGFFTYDGSAIAY